jgi:hypothetical protein
MVWVNMLGVGLHSYGFMEQAFAALLIFIVSQLAIVALGMLRQKYWRGTQARQTSSPQKSSAGKIERIVGWLVAN